MRAQVITTCDYQGGSLQHAVTLARVLRLLGLETHFINLRPPADLSATGVLVASGIDLLTVAPDDLPTAELSFVVDLLELPCCEAARHLVRRNDRLILVPTGYLRDHPLPDFPGKAEALWYVSWDQAADSRSHWNIARRVEVVHCAVDTEHFKPSGRKPSGNPWILSRQSRDRSEKFSQDMFYIFNCLGDTHDIRLRMLGAVETLGVVPDSRVECYAQGSLDVADFLHESDIWFFAHSIYWRESACIAMLEAMACGLPVVVTNAGGMREYMRHGETGFLCNDAQEFIRFLHLLLECPNLYESMSTQARQFVERRHSLEAFAHRVGTLLGILDAR
jgi:glycosyltransferase involved in cell wall biosynthesis